jgi:hypothetical protein
MKRITFLAIFSLLFALQTTKAQNYKSAVGLRLGYPTSISYKHFLNEKGAVEVTGGFRSFAGYARYVALNASYQQHTPIPTVEGLKWYAGGGLGVNFWSYDSFYKALGVNTTSTTFSVFGMIGLDYKIANMPVNVSIDWAPTFFIGSGYYSGFGAGYGSLAARYTLGEKKE